MDTRLQELAELTKSKYGLTNYYLQSHRIDRSVNIFNETIYTLCMEWFPNDAVQKEDDSNPEGTACIELNLKSQRFESVIFVRGKSYAENGVTIANLQTEDIIKWVEDETGLIYGKQFRIHKETDGEVRFKECIDGINVSPSGSIEVKFDPDGKLTFFSVHGQFPSKEIVKEDTYSLSFEKVEHIAKEQLKLIEFPSFEREKVFPVYAVEEIYVTNDQRTTIPFEFIVDVRAYLQIEETLHWDTPLNKSFEHKELVWFEEVTEAQAFSFEPSPDTFPISKMEQEKSVIAVTNLLRQEYPNDSGKWILKSLHRRKGYIHAILRANKFANRVFQRKLTIMIDAKSLQVVNYVDNKPMLEVYDHFQSPDKTTIAKEEAYEKLKGLFELKPYYVYDFKQKKYVLCGKLDCEYGVVASTGDVIALDDI